MKETATVKKLLSVGFDVFVALLAGVCIGIAIQVKDWIGAVVIAVVVCLYLVVSNSIRSSDSIVK